MSYGPLLNAGKPPPPSLWAIKKRDFTAAFFDRVVLAKAKSAVAVGRAYWSLAALRLLLACLPQTGYLHPDEFFQTLEPIAGPSLGVQWSRTWEFNSTQPLRNVALQQFAIGLPLNILQTVHFLLHYYFDISLITPYLVFVLPRLSYCLLSFINDRCLYTICRIYGKEFNRKLIYLATSHISLVYATHTFSNSLEMILLSVLLLLVAECMLTSGHVIKHGEMLTDKYRNADDIVERVKLYKLKKLLPDHSLSRCLQIATVAVVGVFNRPTFFAFALPSVFVWFLRGLGSKYVGFKEFHARLSVFLVCTIPALLLMILFDSSFYGHLTLADVGALEISLESFVVTPLNFLRYNLLLENIAEHGIHPKWLHALVNMPMLFNVLSLTGVGLTLRTCYRVAIGHFKNLPRVQSIEGLMALSIIIPIAVLSLVPHQEPRFLIPLQVPMIFLCVEALEIKKSDGKWKSKIKSHALLIWCTCNIFLTLFFGFLHQGGVYPLANHIHREVSAKPKFTTINIVTSHMYNIPQSLLLTDDTSMIRMNPKTRQKYRLTKQLFLYELGSKSIPYVIKHTKAIWDINESKLKDSEQNFRLYLVLPSSLKNELNMNWLHSNMSIVLKEEKYFFPHFSTEAPPLYPKRGDPSCIFNYQYKKDVSFNVKFTKLQEIFCFIRLFSLSLYKVEDLSRYFN